MARNLIASKLIDSVRKRAFIPDDTSTYTDENVLDILNEEIDVGILSTLMVLNEEHLVVTKDVSFDTNAPRISIPYRAVGNKLREVSYTSAGEVYELSRVSLEEVSDYRRSQSNYYADVFYVEGDEVVLLNTQLAAENIRLHYYLRPNVIVSEDECGKIFNIDRNTGVITLESFPTDFANLPDMDFVQTRSPNKILNFDITPTSINVNQKTVTVNASDIPDNLKVGDYLCKAEESPFPNIPTELHPILAQRAAVFILEAMNDTEGLQNARAKLAQMERSVQNILEDRVEGAPQKINPRHSTLTQATHSRWYSKRRRF
jgi:hypothetical protein